MIYTVKALRHTPRPLRPARVRPRACAEAASSSSRPVTPESSWSRARQSARTLPENPMRVHAWESACARGCSGASPCSTALILNLKGVSLLLVLPVLQLKGVSLLFRSFMIFLHVVYSTVLNDTLWRASIHVAQSWAFDGPHGPFPETDVARRRKIKDPADQRQAAVHAATEESLWLEEAPPALRAVALKSSFCCTDMEASRSMAASQALMKCPYLPRGQGAGRGLWEGEGGLRCLRIL